MHSEHIQKVSLLGLIKAFKPAMLAFALLRHVHLRNAAT